MKDYQGWMDKKQDIERASRAPSVFHRKEIWWCAVGINIGREQDGKHALYERPVLVLRKFNDQLAWIVPVSSKRKVGEYYMCREYDGVVYTFLLSQLRLVSTKRFYRKMRAIPPEDFLLIQQRIAHILFT